jgi:hypothetical protein
MTKTILGLVLSLAIGTVAIAAPQGGADHPAVRLFLCRCLAKEVEVVHRDPPPAAARLQFRTRD